jgi:hypothetical protein
MGNCCCQPDSYDEVKSPITKVQGYSPSSKGERECLRVIKKYLPKYTFEKARPIFLTNPHTGRALELDIYCPELKLAIEYNGIQHYEFTPRFHRDQQAFDEQKYRDDFKRTACKRHGVTLITIRYDCPNIEVEIISKLRYHGFI